MTTEVLRNMIYAGSDALDGPPLRRPRRGALPPEPLPRRGLGRGDHPPARRPSTWCASRRRCRTRRSSRTGSAPSGARRPRSSRSGARSSSRTCTRWGSGASSGIHLLPTFMPGPGGELRPNAEASRLDARGAATGAGRRPRAGPQPPLHAPAGRAGGAAGRGGDAPGDRLHLQPRRVRRRGPAVPRRRVSGSRAADERRELRRIAEARLAALSDEDLDALGHDEWRGRVRGRHRRAPRGDGAADEGSGRGGRSPRAW